MFEILWWFVIADNTEPELIQLHMLHVSVHLSCSPLSPHSPVRQSSPFCLRAFEVVASSLQHAHGWLPQTFQGSFQRPPPPRALANIVPYV